MTVRLEDVASRHRMTEKTTTAAIPGALVSKRLMSVDALRGFDMFWIIGADSLVYALNRMTKSRPTQILADQLEHAEWSGFHFYDLIFPLFIFIMGVSIVFSLTKILKQEGRAGALKRIARRSILLFIVALIYSGGVSHPWPDIRLMGVLNRIAICYFFGGIIFCFCNLRAMAAIAASLLIGYWALLTFVPFPDVRPTPGSNEVITQANYSKVSQLNMDSTNRIRGSYLQGVNLTDYLDQKYLPGKKWDGTYDPEGFLSTLPAIASCLLGIFAGLLLANTNVPDNKKVIYLLGFGVASVALGFLWGTQFPVIKKIWTSSFVLVAGGYSAILLGIFYWIVDVLKFQAWCQPFVWMGMNSITIYLVKNFIGGFGPLSQRFVGGDVKAFFDTHVTQGFGDLMISLVGLALAFWLVHFLYRRKIFLRL
jgi:predicted acyltransferase